MGTKLAVDEKSKEMIQEGKKVGDAVRNIVDKGREQADSYAQTAQTKAQEMAGRLNEKKDKAAHTVDEQLDNYNRKLDRAAAERLPQPLHRSVGQYPWVMIVAGLAVGIAFGFWLKRCR